MTNNEHTEQSEQSELRYALARVTQQLKDGDTLGASLALSEVEKLIDYLLAADKAGGEVVSIEGKTFVRGWLNLEKLPGLMMVSNDGPYGPIPASTTCWITTSERERDYQLAKGEPMLEVWASHPQPQPSSLPDDVVKDAERYRFLEYQCRTGTYRGIISRAAIDAAMLKEEK